MDKESEAKKQESELLSEVGEDTTKYDMENSYHHILHGYHYHNKKGE